jgi:hypothetical protein
LVEALCYKPVGRGLNADEMDFFNLPKHFSRIMNTRNLRGDKMLPVLKADKLTAICEPVV